MSYRPSASNLAAYPELDQIASSGTPLSTRAFHRRPPASLRILPGGELYFDSRLELDTDGWPGGSGRGDRHYQAGTSYRLGDNTPIDANTVPYFVLPQPTDWVKSHRIWLGDVAAVLYEGKLAFAVFADFGGRDTIGEGSIELFRQLGMERLVDGKIINRGSPREGGIVTIVFPNSRPALRYETMAEVVEATKRRGEEHFSALLRMSSRPANGTSLSDAIVGQARRELRKFGRGDENKEPLNSRIALYWRGLGKTYDGSDSDQYWSAAFISFVVSRAGAKSSFTYAQRHSTYVYQAIHDRENGVTGRFWGYRPHDIGIAPGDILAMNQGGGARPISFEEARHSSQYSSHCDIVVKAGPDRVETIGGNVGPPPGTIGTKAFVWARGHLVREDSSEQQVFAVLRPPPIASDS